jgi:DNA primase
MSQFVDFKALRKSLSFEKVLKHYGIDVKIQRGNRHVGFCPLPTHQGKKKSRSFSAKLDHGVWQCFGCKESGNVLDFFLVMEGFDPSNRMEVREGALKAQEIFGAPEVPSQRADSPSGNESKDASPPAKNLPVVVNPPLDFELKNLDVEHPYLKGRGFLPETIKYFGLGYCNRGLMKGRVVIPLHDIDNRLVGYAGRIADDVAISEYCPKYKFPSSRERDGTLLEFRSSYLVYNANRIPTGLVVEGFPSVWWLTQHGYPHCIAVMGNSCSEEQGRLIVSRLAPDGKLWILTDGDKGGDDCAESVFARVAPERWVRWVKLLEDQPTDCTPGDFQSLLWAV